jgi:ribosome-associated heat shock protein Hsp15
MTLDSQRLDKWLWCARFFKSRTIASRLCADGRVRINRVVTRKAHQPIHIDDVLTFPQSRGIRVVRVKALAPRRGPAKEAQALYEDLAPPDPRARRRPAKADLGIV